MTFEGWHSLANIPQPGCRLVVSVSSEGCAIDRTVPAYAIAVGEGRTRNRHQRSNIGSRWSRQCWFRSIPHSAFRVPYSVPIWSSVSPRICSRTCGVHMSGWIHWAMLAVQVDPWCSPGPDHHRNQASHLATNESNNKTRRMEKRHAD